jgi:pyruvate dehydrogenase E1 component
MIPFYIFYSMFGFQRTGDSIWAMADQLARGFLIGATAGRTTLTGEGLQHADGHSPLLATTNPAVVHYDPAFAYEVSHIMRSGLERMYGGDNESAGEDVIFYLTVYNEPIVQPKEPEGVDAEGIVRGIHRVAGAPEGEGPKAQILASGVSVPWALDAQRMLAEEWGVQAAVWSVTSWGELRRDGLQCDEHNLMNPEGEQRQPYVTRKLDGAPGPFVAVSDYMRAVQDQIMPWVPGDFSSLGTDGFGLSDTRSALRRHFKVDAWCIVAKTLAELARRGEVKAETAREAIDRYRIWDVTAPPAGETEGGAE